MITSASEYQLCTDECVACAIECRICNTACLLEPDMNVLAHCIRLTDECAAICLLAMNSMTGNSKFAADVCKLCATICTACAVECEKHQHVEHCARCAAQCRKCAAACRSMHKTKK